MFIGKQMDEKNFFILIDDVAINNMLSRLIIKSVYPTTKVVEHNQPADGLAYIATEFESNPTTNAILLLDIYMPNMDGWEFLDKFDQLSESIKNRIKIFVLSSSISRVDKERADTNKNVLGFAVKPFSKETLTAIVASCTGTGKMGN